MKEEVDPRWEQDPLNVRLGLWWLAAALVGPQMAGAGPHHLHWKQWLQLWLSMEGIEEYQYSLRSHCHQREEQMHSLQYRPPRAVASHACRRDGFISLVKG